MSIFQKFINKKNAETGSLVALDLKKAIKTTYITQPTLLKKSTISPYKDNYIFKIERIGYLAQLQLKFILTSTSQTNAKKFLAKRIASLINLTTERGRLNIQSITPPYTGARLDSLNWDSLTCLMNSYDSEIEFNNNTVTVYNTLFFYFSEDPSMFINTKGIENLELSVFINDSKESMGLEADLTDLKIELISTYFDPLGKGTYDNFHIVNKKFTSFDHITQIEELTQGSTESTFILTEGINFNVYNISMLIKTDDQRYINVNGFKLYSKNTDIINFSRKGSSYIWDQKTGYDSDSGTLIYWFSLYRDRLGSKRTESLKELEPVSITVSHDTIQNSSTKIYIFFEYYIENLIKNGLWSSNKEVYHNDIIY